MSIQKLHQQVRLPFGQAGENNTVKKRVPMFYYIVHIFFIHLLAMLAAELTGFHWYNMVLERRTQFETGLKGYGFSLMTTYLVWIGIVLILYPLCKWYDAYKTRHTGQWWLSYI